MSSKITINSVVWNATPAGNQTCTIHHRPCGSVGAWTLVTAAQVINPAGLLVPAAVITGLDEDTCYEFRITNNCATSENPNVKEITTASTNDTLTFYNKMSADTITSISIDGGANILGAPIAAGGNFPYVAPGLYGNTHLIEVTLGLLATKMVYFLVDDTEIDVGGEYLVAINATEFVGFNNNIPVGKDFYIRDGNYHEKTSQYSATKGGMHSACSIGIPAGIISRTQTAANDSVNAAAIVGVTVEWTPDNAQPPVSESYDMNPGVLTVPVGTLLISATPCADVAGVVTFLIVP